MRPRLRLVKDRLKSDPGFTATLQWDGLLHSPSPFVSSSFLLIIKLYISGKDLKIY